MKNRVLAIPTIENEWMEKLILAKFFHSEVKTSLELK